jgi:superfamily II DNA or RNA helicase
MSTRSLAADRCAPSFSPGVRARGRRYALEGNVQIVRSDPHRIEALVRGSRARPYVVVLCPVAAPSLLEATCDCPFAADLDLCKHTYAVIIECDRRGLSPSLLGPGGSMVRVVPVLPSEDGSATRKAPDGLEDDDEWDDDDDEWDEDDDEWDEEPPIHGYAVGRGRAFQRTARPFPRGPQWKRLVDVMGCNVADRQVVPLAERGRTKTRLEYHLTSRRTHLDVRLRRRVVRKDGTLGVARSEVIRTLPSADLDQDDAAIVSIAAGCSEFPSIGGGFVIPAALVSELLPRLCATERFGLPDPIDPEHGPLHPLAWDDGEPYRVALRIEPDGEAGAIRLRAVLRRGDEVVDAGASRLLLAGAVVIGDRIARLHGADRGHPRWMAELRDEAQAPATWALRIPKTSVRAFLKRLAGRRSLPEIEIDPALPWREAAREPAPRLRVVSRARTQATALGAQVWFDYGDHVVRYGRGGGVLFDAKAQWLTPRDEARERSWAVSLEAQGFARARWEARSGLDADVEIGAKDFASAARALLGAGWTIEAEGKLLRQASRAPSIHVTSGVDWFDLGLEADFGEGARVGLPELLAALRRRDAFVKLSDGSQGMVPEEWFARFAPLAALGEVAGEKIRFSRTSGVLLDLMLASQPEVDVDAGFARFRRELRRFDGVEPAQAPRVFKGALRDYQKVGLGWLKTIQRFGFGGCLADDMGLGKTIQVLALIASTPRARRGGPTLVVAPKSLVFNWLDEARRFVPSLEVAAYTGPAHERRALIDRIGEVDVLVTTYGTLRRDIDRLVGAKFFYVVLDEAQAIKNPTSQIAKACRLLRSEHRLALTGTPIENHLGDLASIFEFLNPGMIHGLEILRGLAERQPGAQQLSALSHALKPFLLRRTKAAVLTELPDKTEQVLRCRLERKQRSHYDELRKYYRAALERRIDEQGLEGSKIYVLDALLRLRQAACHPALIDSDRRTEPCAKLDVLIEGLAEVIGAGHKALVFSQFTSFLALARERLEEAGIVYAYLDGKTRHRKAAVERFQTDPSCTAFLISLKAGGHGLNLTAADYVFLLDPWWNPAVEAQAIDRAHRIGQQRPVFAYRLIAADTVEERVLKLQKAKRELAEGILAGDASLLGRLTREDLEVLLS